LPPSETTLQRIKKLLALADGNPNEHEREVAMQFALDLLGKHNLTVTDVEDADFDQQTKEFHVDMKLDKWVRYVLTATSKLYYTDYYIHQTRTWNGSLKNTPAFIGTEENVAVTIEVATWLLNSIRLESNYTYTDPSDRRSFRLGAAFRILERAFEIITAEELAEKHSKSNNSSGTSLMVIRNSLQAANQRYLANMNLKEFKSRRAYIDREAYDEGANFGDSVGLARQTRTKGRIEMRA
jgi:hypothetical protein